MARQGLEVADVFRHFGPAYRDQHAASLSSARQRAAAQRRLMPRVRREMAMWGQVASHWWMSM